MYEVFSSSESGKREPCLVVRENMAVYEVLLEILQMKSIYDEFCKLTDSPLKSPTIPYIMGTLWGIFPA